LIHYMSLRSLKLILSCLIALVAPKLQAQLAATPITVETLVHYGDYGDGVDLTGYVTYYVYVNFQNGANYLTSIYGEEANADCIQDDINGLFMEFECNVFQHEAEGAFGYGQGCFYDLGFFQSSLYDSFLTIGASCGADPTCDLSGSLGSCLDWITNFEGLVNGDPFDGGSFYWDEYALFNIPCNVSVPGNISLSYAGADNRVLIGQFTTCGNMNGCINLTYRTQQMLDDGDINGELITNVCFEATHPCLTLPLITTPNLNLANCAGEMASINIPQSGNGLVNFELHNSLGAVLESYPNQVALNATGISVGTYFITMIDEAGCRDTTDLFEIIEPDPIVLTAELSQDVQCFGELTGVIDIFSTGGTDELTLTVNGQDFANVVSLPGLGCGEYLVLVQDDNGCSEDTTIGVSCPLQLIYNPTITSIECYGYDDGSIVGSVTGGTGNITFDWNYNSEPYQNFEGPAPLNPSIDLLDSGIYDYILSDVNGCEMDGSFEITEPGDFIATPTVTDATCYTFCDGEVAFEIVGGTPPTALAVTGTNGAANPTALCAGTYNYIITDDNGCTVSGEIVVDEQPEITYESLTTPVTCFGQCDGAITLQNVQGGYDGFTYALTPNSALCVDPCNGNQVAYESVCAGTYSVLITDQNGCLQTVTNLMVATPAPLEMILDVNDVTCFGYDNGTIGFTANGGSDPIILTPSDLELPLTVDNLAPNTYTYTITDANGCTDTEDITINEPPILVAAVTSINEPTCGGECDGSIFYEVQGGTPPYIYLLNSSGQNGLVNGTITSLCALDYELVVTDLLNCLDTNAFTINEPDPLGIDIILDAPTCTGMFDGGAVLNLLGGTGPLTLFFEPNDTDFDITNDSTYQFFNLGEGEISMVLIDSVECAYLDTLEIVPDIITDMVLTGFSSPESCWNTNDGTVTMAVQNGNLPITFEWNDDLSQTTAVATGLEGSQTYVVVVTDAIGCTLSEEVFVEPTEGCFFISTGITPNGDGDNDLWLLGGLEYYPSAKIQVFNRWGQTVFESTGYNAPWDGSYQGQALPIADYYFVIDYQEDKEPITGTVTIKY
jgi:gliding motility-associated-like protein